MRSHWRKVISARHSRRMSGLSTSQCWQPRLSLVLSVLDPPLVTGDVDQDAPVRRAPPDFSFLPFAAVDLALNRFDRVTRYGVGKGQQHVTCGCNDYGSAR